MLIREKLYIGELQEGQVVVSCSNTEYLKTFDYLICESVYLIFPVCVRMLRTTLSLLDVYCDSWGPDYHYWMITATVSQAPSDEVIEK